MLIKISSERVTFAQKDSRTGCLLRDLGVAIRHNCLPVRPSSNGAINSSDVGPEHNPTEADFQV